MIHVRCAYMYSVYTHYTHSTQHAACIFGVMPPDMHMDTLYNIGQRAVKSRCCVHVYAHEDACFIPITEHPPAGTCTLNI